MQRFIIVLQIVCLYFLACDLKNPTAIEKKSISDQNTITNNETSRSFLGEWTDWSGRVKISIWESSAYGSHPIVTCPVDPDYVLIGGGAYVQYRGGNGGLLTASYPQNDQLEVWVAESKDHIWATPHTLHCYSIGLKLEGVDSHTLRQLLIFKSVTSTTQPHSSVSVFVPDDYTLIGGGARVNYIGVGNMLTESYPYDSRTWRVKSKDHLIADPATITAYAIGIKSEYIPNFGYIEIQSMNDSAYQSAGFGSIGHNVTSGWVLSCVGGKATWNGVGRMLTRIAPVPFHGTEILATSKDHGIVDDGYTYVYYRQIRKRP